MCGITIASYVHMEALLAVIAFVVIRIYLNQSSHNDHVRKEIEWEKWRREKLAEVEERREEHARKIGLKA